MMSPMVTRSLKGLVIGAPGSGKGTLTSWLVRDFPVLKVVSTGDELRREILAKTPRGLLATEYMRKGKLVPDNDMLSLVSGALARTNAFSGSASWLLDGFPRTVGQADELDKMLAKHDCALDHVLVLDVPFDVILNRVRNRWVHVESGRVYNLEFNPPKRAGLDDVTGEPLEQREDDNEATVAKRLVAYREKTAPLIEKYRQLGIVEVFQGHSSDEIYPHLHDYVSQTLRPSRRSPTATTAV